jgi:hypothetical protein
MDEEKAIKKAMQVLIKELGPVEAIRFITIPKSKRIESVKRHREWQKMLSKDIFFQKSSPSPFLLYFSLYSVFPQLYLHSG